MTTFTETILSTFPECPIALLEGVPTHTYMTEVNGFLNACAASVHCNLGNVTVGYLVLTAQPASFQIASPTSFVKPVNPGVLVLGYPAPSAAVIRSLTRHPTEDTWVFNEYHSVNRACKKSPLYTSSGGIIPVIQEQVHRVRERTMSRNSVTFMEYIRGIKRL